MLWSAALLLLGVIFFVLFFAIKGYRDPWGGPEARAMEQLGSAVLLAMFFVCLFFAAYTFMTEVLQ